MWVVVVFKLSLSHRLHTLDDCRRFVIKEAPDSSPVTELVLRQCGLAVYYIYIFFFVCVCPASPLLPFAELNPSPCIVNSTLFAHQICKKVSSCVFRISKYKYTHANLSGTRFPLMRREGGCAFVNRTLPRKFQGCLAEI